ncbi:aspartate aminotransferase family protein [Leptospirillum ferriphilum]|uniref:Acetylornithine aminotransferase n=1 Tax=Leptospirillum ferriphilum YSK TaxID=1441628 RepID=A0A059Y0Z1_9BACT|nr:acetylornithine aminotransferase [Leptospirillum ferriphilum YSK]OOH77888.1 aspartate aminotransferase family protein [Leptospirillum ferriphilum]
MKSTKKEGWEERGARVLLGNYSREPLVFEKGRGSYLFDPSGVAYLDFLGGIAIHVLGHCHPGITHAIQKQAQRMVHVSNLYYNPAVVDLAELLVEKTFADRVFFSNSGTEAIEAAIKLARRYGASSGRYEMISMEGSFHGRTLGAMTLTGQAKVREGFGPLPPGFLYAPFNDFDKIRASRTKNTVAVIVEPVQGEIGVIPAETDFLQKLRRWTREEDILLILDEIQTGLGRTGSLFAYEQYEIIPDILVSSKALGGGLPLGAVLTSERLSKFLPPGTHGSTFGGNPVACAAGAALVRALFAEDFLPERVRSMSSYLWDGLMALKNRYPSLIREIRGKGFMIGCVVSVSAKKIKDLFREERVLVNATGPADDVIRILPPLSISYDETDDFLSVADKIFSSLSVEKS